MPGHPLPLRPAVSRAGSGAHSPSAMPRSRRGEAHLRAARPLDRLCAPGASILLIGVWCSLAAWFRGLGGQTARDLLAGATLVLALMTVGCLATSWRWRALAAYVAL